MTGQTADKPTWVVLSEERGEHGPLLFGYAVEHTPPERAREMLTYHMWLSVVEIITSYGHGRWTEIPQVWPAGEGPMAGRWEAATAYWYGEYWPDSEREALERELGIPPETR